MSKRTKILFIAASAIFACAGIVQFSAQAERRQSAAAQIRVGEKITYAISFGKFNNAAFAEISAVSRGKLANRDAIELHGRFKTLDFVSAVYYMIDETRTVFVAADSLLPLYVNSVQNAGTLPRETNSSFLTVQAQGFDLVSMVYKMRQSGGTGALTLVEDGKVYIVTMQTVGAERVKTDAGEYDTSIVAVQSEYFTEHGLKGVQINLSNDEARIPVMVRVKTAKGEFKMVASGVVVTEPEPAATPVLVQTPPPSPTPRPIATATPYIDNQPLAGELAFDLGETLEYRITNAGQPIGNFTFEAKERKQFDGRDGLMLKGSATRADAGNRFFAANDGVTAVVNPETLAPRRSEIKFSGSLSSYNQLVQFDPATGKVSFNGPNPVDAPVGTHSILSLFYALRSFNMKPSKDMKNPVNDTRVAVFWENQPYIFTLRPSEVQVITLHGQKFPAQMISITTQNQFLDQLAPKVWLGIDERRLPLKFSFGSIEGELVGTSAQSR